jgi:hypothetical protein
MTTTRITDRFTLFLPDGSPVKIIEKAEFEQIRDNQGSGIVQKNKSFETEFGQHVNFRPPDNYFLLDGTPLVRG